AGRPAAGGLLPHHFTLTASGPPETISDGGVISVALSFGSPRLGVTQRPALRSPDFPPTLFTSPAVTRPPRPGWILPANVRKHALRASGQEPAIGRLEQTVDEVADKPFGFAVHLDRHDAAPALARPDLHSPGAPGLRRIRLLHR